jgi:hypothetical protein
MSIHTQLCSFKTADKETLHGLLFTPPNIHSSLPTVCEELADAAGPSIATCEIIAGANHSYSKARTGGD